MNNWICLLIKGAPDASETIAAVLAEAGACGTQIDDTEVRLDESEDATLAQKAEPLVRAYFEIAEGESEADVIARAQAALAENGLEASVEVEPVAEEDWSTSWRQNFPPLPIGPFLIAPTWDDEATVGHEDAIIILLDPGLAFGTGQHPTTFLCLELLAQELDKKEARTVLDVGCGSGILSIAAAKLGAEVTASDLDPFCTAATVENAELNNVKVKVEEIAGADWTSEKFDLVVANLMSDLLIRLTTELRSRVKDGGTLIVSGISAPRADDVEAAMHAAGFTTVEKRERDGDHRGDFLEQWAAFVFKTA